MLLFARGAARFLHGCEIRCIGDFLLEEFSSHPTKLRCCEKYGEENAFTYQKIIDDGEHPLSRFRNLAGTREEKSLEKESSIYNNTKCLHSIAT